MAIGQTVKAHPLILSCQVSESRPPFPLSWVVGLT